MLGAIPTLPQYVLMAWWSVKHRISLYGVALGKNRANFTLNFTYSSGTHRLANYLPFF
jgi:hypothetical protein